MAVLAKTGVRRGELISMDVEDIDWGYQRIKLKPKNKRSNLYVYFDEETDILLHRWLRVRDGYAKPSEDFCLLVTSGNGLEGTLFTIL